MAVFASTLAVARGVEAPEQLASRPTSTAPPTQRTTTEPPATGAQGCPPVPASAKQVGIAPGSWWPNDPAWPSDLDVMAASGVRWLRVGFEWITIEKQPGVYSWAKFDRVVQAARRRCIRVLGMIGTTASFARPPGCDEIWCYPADPAAFADLVRRVVERYAPMGVEAWEVWNEANIRPFAAPAPSPEAYMRILRPAVEAIRAVDREATILTAGLAPASVTNDRQVNPAEFIEKLYEGRALVGVDALAFHPYSYPLLPTVATGDNGWVDQLPAIRLVMYDHHDEVRKVWLTEFGVPTGSAAGGTDDQGEVDGLIAAFGLWRATAWAGPLFWYEWRDQTSGRRLPLDFGLVNGDGSPKPALDEFRRQAAR